MQQGFVQLGRALCNLQCTWSSSVTQGKITHKEEITKVQKAAIQEEIVLKKNPNNLLIECIPFRVDLLQVVLQLLGVGALGCCLDQILAEGVDVLKMHLQWINVLFLESLRTNNKANKSNQILQTAMRFSHRHMKKNNKLDKGNYTIFLVL